MWCRLRVGPRRGRGEKGHGEEDVEGEVHLEIFILAVVSLFDRKARIGYLDLPGA